MRSSRRSPAGGTWRSVSAETDARLRKLCDVIRNDKQYGRAIGFRYHDGKPGIVEGLLSRGDRRVGKVIRAVWEDAADRGYIERRSVEGQGVCVFVTRAGEDFLTSRRRAVGS